MVVKLQMIPKHKEIIIKVVYYFSIIFQSYEVMIAVLLIHLSCMGCLLILPLCFHIIYEAWKFHSQFIIKFMEKSN